MDGLFHGEPGGVCVEEGNFARAGEERDSAAGIVLTGPREGPGSEETRAAARPEGLGAALAHFSCTNAVVAVVNKGHASSSAFESEL